MISGHFRQNGREFLTTFRALPGTQDWLVGIVVPREFYLGKLVTIRNHMLIALSVVMLLLSAGAIAILRSIKYAQEKITRESLKMKCFRLFADSNNFRIPGRKRGAGKPGEGRRRRCER